MAVLLLVLVLVLVLLLVLLLLLLRVPTPPRLVYTAAVTLSLRPLAPTGEDRDESVRGFPVG